MTGPGRVRSGVTHQLQTHTVTHIYVKYMYIYASCMLIYVSIYVYIYIYVLICGDLYKLGCAIYVQLLHIFSIYVNIYVDLHIYVSIYVKKISPHTFTYISNASMSISVVLVDIDGQVLDLAIFQSYTVTVVDH